MRTILIALITTTLLFSCDSPNTNKAVSHGAINSCVDGVCLKQINLWSSINEEGTRQTVASLPDYTEADILTIVDDYCYVINATDKNNMAIT